MKKRTKIIIGGTVGVLVVGGVIVTQFGKSNEKHTIPTTQVQEQPALKESGVVQPMQVQDVSLGSMKPGQILVKDGQSVKVGDALMTLEASDGKTDVSEAQAEVTKLQTQVGIQQDALNDAQKSVNSEDGGGQAAVTQAKMALSEAQNDLTAAQAKVANIQAKVATTVVAKFDGVVVLDQTDPDAPKLQVYSHKKQVVTTVSDGDYDKVKPDAEVTVNGVSNHSKETTQHVLTVSAVPTKDSNRKLAKYEFTVTLDDTFRYGQPVTVSLAQHGIVVPKSAVKTVDGQKMLYRVVNGRAVKTVVDGHTGDNNVIVTANLSERDRVVTDYDSAKNGEVIDAAN
jgi:HlyD family secretion protein